MYGLVGFMVLWSKPIIQPTKPWSQSGLDVAKRGPFKVKFFADFGEEDCAPNNIMPYDDYDRRKSEGKTTKFFGVPKKFEPNFEKALTLAIEHNTAK